MQKYLHVPIFPSPHMSQVLQVLPILTVHIWESVCVYTVHCEPLPFLHPAPEMIPHIILCFGFSVLGGVSHADKNELHFLYPSIICNHQKRTYSTKNSKWSDQFKTFFLKWSRADTYGRSENSHHLLKYLPKNYTSGKNQFGLDSGIGVGGIPNISSHIHRAP